MANPPTTVTGPVLSSDPAITTTHTAGSYVVTKHTEREMKLYGVYESELRTIAILNGITALFASLGTGLVAFAAGQVVDLAKSTASPAGQNLVVTVCWVSGILAVACYAIAGLAFWYKHSEVSEIKSKSRPVP
jgi:hypothetical protein